MQLYKDKVLHTSFKMYAFNRHLAVCGELLVRVPLLFYSQFFSLTEHLNGKHVEEGIDYVISRYDMIDLSVEKLRKNICGSEIYSLG